MEENKKLICSRCNEELTMANANFSYLKHSFHTEVLRCPKCGRVSNSRHRRCLYCGLEFQGDIFG